MDVSDVSTDSSTRVSFTSLTQNPSGSYFHNLQDMITDISMKWSKIARTGAIEVKFMGVDVSTIMFTLEKGQDTLALKEFILSQPEVYEIKIGDQLFRRPGDRSFDDVFAEIHRNDYNHHEKDEL